MGGSPGSGPPGPARRAGPPAWGDRVGGRGRSGRVVVDGLAAATGQRRVRVLGQTRARRLLTDDGGGVGGVECTPLRGLPAFAHRLLHRVAAKPWLYVPK